MKDAKNYEKKIKKILTGVASRPSAGKTFATREPFEVLVEGILQAETGEKKSAGALVDLRKEFVDFNELRVSLTKEIVECLGKSYPDAANKGQMLSTVLNAIFYHNNDMSMDYMAKMQIKPLRRHLKELGLDPFVSAYVTMYAFGIRALPVDQVLLESLQMNGDLPENMDIEQARRFLERLTSKNDLTAVYDRFRQYVTKNDSALTKRRKAQAKAKALAEAKAKAKAEAKAKAKAQAKAKAAKKARAKAKAKADKSAKKVKKTVKKAAKKTAKKVRKKSVKKTIKKAAKKIAKKVVKKTAKKTVKKTVKKAAGKTVKKSKRAGGKR